MILPLKIALGLIVTLALGLIGTGWYAKSVAEERDAANKEIGRLELAVETSALQAKERAATNARLLKLLQTRKARKAEVLALSNNLQEKIDALTNTCTLSDSAHGVLWEIYERTSGVQGTRSLRSASTGTDGSTGAPQSASN